MTKPDQRADARYVLERLTAMGVNARLLEGDRCVLASMRLQSLPFEAPSSSLRIGQVIFTSVGRDRIKCLKPRALFQLPMIRIADCRDSTAIEARIRLAWKRHSESLNDARAWLESIGAEVDEIEESSVLSFPIEGEKRRARAMMIDERRIVLPSQGQLSGVTLQRAEDRTFFVDRSIPSSVELEIAVSTRLEELQRLERRLNEEQRRAGLTGSSGDEREAGPKRSVRLLLLGPQIAKQQQCIDSLRLRGYVVDVAQQEQDGLAIYDRHSPELALVDMQMDRNEGISFLLSLRKITGVEEIPVILVDDKRRDSNREAARRVGAAGYLVHPVDVQRIAGRLDTLAREPHRRRFTRYNRRLPVQVRGAGHPCMVTTLGRGGMFIATDDGLRTNSLQSCRVSLPEVDRTISCEAEVVYRRGNVGRTRGGVGVRFHAFSGRDENALIEYLHSIDHATAPSA